MVHKLSRVVQFYLLNRVARINPAPLFVLGNQKSGTSAIAALLAQALRASLTLDLIVTPGYEKDLLAAHCSQNGFLDFLNKRKYEFSKEVIKEPSLTLLFEQLNRVFPSARSIFVVRDPRENIRSILDRLSIPGHLRNNPDLNRLHPFVWKRFFELGCPDTENFPHYIERLAWRWNSMADIYLARSEAMICVSYEAFIRDKAGVIHDLAGQSGGACPVERLHSLDCQYQPRGEFRDKSWWDFFRQENLARIESICQERMLALGYGKG